VCLDFLSPGNKKAVNLRKFSTREVQRYRSQ
jgi:hypothetical protein